MAAAGAGPAAIIIAALYLPLAAVIVITPQLMQPKKAGLPVAEQ